jgi:NAD(P)-dependent dehydrogenase (short-subunit alcohol dehydrogenase family)
MPVSPKRHAAQVPSAKAHVCDVSDQSQVDSTMALVEREMGAPSVLIHNAAGGAWGTFMEVDPPTLNRNFQVNTMGLLYLARRLAPTMVTAGQGAIIVTGNTSAQRGRANFAGFAPTKAANAFSPKRWRGTWAPRACTSPTLSSMQ